MEFSRRAMGWIGSIGSLIVHTLLFTAAFALALFGVPIDKILLVVTTAVSLEAIYMAIFIQMAVNHNTQTLDEVEEDLGEIQEDVEDIEKDIDEIQEDVEDIEKDIDEIQEDVEDIHEEEVAEADSEAQEAAAFKNIELRLQELAAEIAKLKKGA